MAQDQFVLIMFNRYADDFEALLWTTQLGGPYEVTNPLQAMVMEAGAKGLAVVINAALVSPEVFFPEASEEEVLSYDDASEVEV